MTWDFHILITDDNDDKGSDICDIEQFLLYPFVTVCDHPVLQQLLPYILSLLWAWFPQVSLHKQKVQKGMT